MYSFDGTAEERIQRIKRVAFLEFKDRELTDYVKTRIVKRYLSQIPIMYSRLSMYKAKRINRRYSDISSLPAIDKEIQILEEVRDYMISQIQNLPADFSLINTLYLKYVEGRRMEGDIGLYTVYSRRSTYRYAREGAVIFYDTYFKGERD